MEKNKNSKLKVKTICYTAIHTRVLFRNIVKLYIESNTVTWGAVTE